MVQRGGLFVRQGRQRIVFSIGCQVRPDTAAMRTNAGSFNSAETLC